MIKRPNRITLASVAALSLTLISSFHAPAAVVPLETVPVATAGGAKPNLMIIFDDSGSMAYDFLPNGINPQGGEIPPGFPTEARYCKIREMNASGWGIHRYCLPGDPPYYASDVNKVYYNPAITYAPPSRANRSLMNAQNRTNTSNWTSVQSDPYMNPGMTFNLAQNYQEIAYCDSKGADAQNDAVHCKRNLTGYDYPDNTSLIATPAEHYYQYGFGGSPIRLAAGTFRYARERTGAPYFFRITPTEYCSDNTLVNCDTTQSAAYPVPAPLRWCLSSPDSVATGAVSGNDARGRIRCQAFPRALPNSQRDMTAFDEKDTNFAFGYFHPRYGTFVRENITSSTSTYVRPASRYDCATSMACTYDEEMTNFANWFAYYRTRLNMAKTTLGKSFEPITASVRLGFITINSGSSVKSTRAAWSYFTKYSPIKDFASTARDDWYGALYSRYASGDTPLREALSRVGRIYQAKTDKINSDIWDNTDGDLRPDPIQASCQANYSLLTTDGYWTNKTSEVAVNAVGTQFNGTGDDYSATPPPAPPNVSLTDLAKSYFETDLRPAGSMNRDGVNVGEDNVPEAGEDKNKFQHMTTFTLGLLPGTLNYRDDYKNEDMKDPAIWPAPVPLDLTALDDLWHAAVVGGGRFYLASDTESLKKSLADMLLRIISKDGAASAITVSNQTPVAGDNSVFFASYTTGSWIGELIATEIDPVTVTISTTPKWQASKLLATKVSATSDTRNIFTSRVNGTKINFNYDDLGPDQAKFDNKCSLLSQCGGLSTVETGIANDGRAIVNYLRGRSLNEGRIFRSRVARLGDIGASTPVFMPAPYRNFLDSVTPSYSSFKTGAAATRKKVVFVGANDGQLHAFDSETGQELWAYVPRILFSKLYKLADLEYSDKHEMFVEGTVETMDIFDTSTSPGQWRTILIGGLNGGGRGFYALDVTNPEAPDTLWEACPDASICRYADNDIGYSFGRAVIAKRTGSPDWTVMITSGYNNVSPGDGKGHVFVLNPITGALIEKINLNFGGTSEGSSTDPSGFARVSAWVDNYDVDMTALRLYGGDLKGNVARISFAGATSTVQRIATLVDGTGKPQPVSTAPELTTLNGESLVMIGTGKYLSRSDRKDPATLTPPVTEAFMQSIYTFKDPRTTDMGSLRLPSNKLVKQTLSVASATDSSRTISENAVDWTTKNGWYVDFDLTGTNAGERITLDPILDSGKLEVATIIPSDDQCKGTGQTFAYSFNFKDGAAVEGALVTAGGVKAVGVKVADKLGVGETFIRINGRSYVLTRAADGTILKVDMGASSVASGGRPVSWRELLH